MDIILEPKGFIDRKSSMYPCDVVKLSRESYSIPLTASVYGVVLNGQAWLTRKDNQEKVVDKFEYFCVNQATYKSITASGETALFVRYGFNGQNTIGGPVEDRGRLVYIDNCSDSLLIYPPRLGDPSMSLLFFPPNILQRFHTHPSFRLGAVLKGEGQSHTEFGTYDLKPGMVFCMNEQEIHRFVTTTSSLTVMSFHPDGDWGPTDHNHTMLNRTYSNMLEGAAGNVHVKP